MTMRHFRAAAALAAMAVLPEVSAANIRSPVFVQPAHHAERVYVSDAYQSFVAIFDRQGNLAGTITAGIDHRRACSSTGITICGSPTRAAATSCAFAAGALDAV